MDLSYTNMLAHLNVGSAHPGGLTATKQAYQQLQAYPHETILDAGCGTGRTLAYLTEVTNSQLFGVDQHETMLTQTKKRLKNSEHVELILANLKQLPFETKTIDCIFSESVVSFTSIEAVLKEYYRVLRNQGVLCLIEITALPSLTTQELDKMNAFYGTHSILTEAEWQDKINQAGFQVINKTRLPATTTGEVDLQFSETIDPIYIDFLTYHYQQIEAIQAKVEGYLFFCQKNPEQTPENGDF